MSKEKQINEIAKIIARRSMAFRNPNVAFMTTARKTADSIYNADYRKQSEIVKEIFDDIENKLLNHVGDYHGCYHTKYNVGDAVYCYSCFNGELFPEKEPYVIYEVVVSTSAFGTKVFYRVKRTVDTVQTYDIFSERQCFETYEKCAHHCSTQ